MQFYQITEELAAHPGEYLYHAPTKQVVMCGSFSRALNRVRVLGRGQMFTDKIQNFRKIKLTDEEKSHMRCKGCTGR